MAQHSAALPLSQPLTEEKKEEKNTRAHREKERERGRTLARGLSETHPMERLAENVAMNNNAESASFQCCQCNEIIDNDKQVEIDLMQEHFRYKKHKLFEIKVKILFFLLYDFHT